MSAEPTTNSGKKLKKEIIIFLIFLGILVSALGSLALFGLKNGAPPFWGMNRGIAVGVPTLIIGLCHLISGVLLAVTSKKLYATLGAVAGTALAIFYFVFLISATGRLPVNLLSIVVVAIPYGLWSRVYELMQADSEQPDKN